MEIYRGTVPTATFIHPTPDTSVTGAKWSLNGSELETLSPVPGTGSTTARLPYIQSDGLLKIEWTFNIPGSGTFTEETYAEVVTPILPLSEVKRIVETDDDAEAAEVEKAVRNIIQAHCGQSFGKKVETKHIVGGGDTIIYLPERLLVWDKVNGVTPPDRFALSDNKYMIKFRRIGVPPLKADYDGLHYLTGGVIENPNGVSIKAWDQFVYEIEGTWGWDYVPSAVAEAAKLLVNDYACGDANYRDRYLTSMTAADWRIQFNQGAFENTGNVRADQLLSEYIIVRGMRVI